MKLTIIWLYKPEVIDITSSYIIAYERWRRLRQPTHVEGWPSSYSPLANYGRFCLEWRPSTSQAHHERGGPSPLAGPWHMPDIAPYGELDTQQDDPFAETWGGHVWSTWQDVRECAFYGDRQGLYRLWKPDSPDLWVLGFGWLASAARKAASISGDVLISAVVGDWTERQMDELKTDLLGLYACQRQTFPIAQYGGKDNGTAGGAWPDKVQAGDQEWDEANVSSQQERSW